MIFVVDNFDNDSYKNLSMLELKSSKLQIEYLCNGYINNYRMVITPNIIKFSINDSNNKMTFKFKNKEMNFFRSESDGLVILELKDMCSIIGINLLYNYNFYHLICCKEKHDGVGYKKIFNFI